MAYILVGVGAAIGAVLRYGINRFFEKRPHPFPKATLLINLSGALLLGILAGLQIDQQQYLLLGTGVMGGYTTFSTMTIELVSLYRINRRYFYLYFVSTYVVGLTASFIGLMVGASLN
ncbi:CrcB family protein [Enterococcus sp.]|jgi:CrcB protein|uniref:fluoride efflux transporter FluC n=1 Tax=Enterococcus sp. TaxID=35783 RepID=UPI0025C5657E|nr:CrcB family protein [Enterococcus sp.]